MQTSASEACRLTRVVQAVHISVIMQSSISLITATMAWHHRFPRQAVGACWCQRMTARLCMRATGLASKGGVPTTYTAVTGITGPASKNGVSKACIAVTRMIEHTPCAVQGAQFLAAASLRLPETSCSSKQASRQLMQANSKQPSMRIHPSWWSPRRRIFGASGGMAS